MYERERKCACAFCAMFLTSSWVCMLFFFSTSSFSSWIFRWLVKLKVVGQWTWMFCSVSLFILQIRIELFQLRAEVYVIFLFDISDESLLFVGEKGKKISPILRNVCFTREFIDITCCWLQLKMHSNSDLIRQNLLALNGLNRSGKKTDDDDEPKSISTPNRKTFVTEHGQRKTDEREKITYRRSWHCKTFRDTNLSNYRVPSYLLHFSFLDLANFCCFNRFVSFVDDCNMLSKPLLLLHHFTSISRSQISVKLSIFLTFSFVFVRCLVLILNTCAPTTSNAKFLSGFD